MSEEEVKFETFSLSEILNVVTELPVFTPGRFIDMSPVCSAAMGFPVDSDYLRYHYYQAVRDYLLNENADTAQLRNITSNDIRFLFKMVDGKNPEIQMEQAKKWMMLVKDIYNLKNSYEVLVGECIKEYPAA